MCSTLLRILILSYGVIEAHWLRREATDTSDI